MKILLVSWSHVDLIFKKFLLARVGGELISLRFSHHPTWNTPNRSYLRNALHIMNLLVRAIFQGYGTIRIVFGTNSCRFLFPLFLSRRTFYIFNELPQESYGFLGLYDRLIFCCSKNIAVSTEARRKLLDRLGYKSSHVQILENITFDTVFNLPPVSRDQKRGVLIGTLDKTRFGEEAVKILYDLTSNGMQVDVYASLIERGLQLDCPGVRFLAPLPHDLMLSKLTEYDFGILSYEPVSLNNFYAAPLKLYEYVNAGLRVVSLFHNAGIESVRLQYPDLFCDSPLLPGGANQGYARDRHTFLSSAIEGNRSYADEITSSLKG